MTKNFKLSINFEEVIFENSSLLEVWKCSKSIEKRIGYWISEYENSIEIDYCSLNFFMDRFISESFVPKTISELQMKTLYEKNKYIYKALQNEELCEKLDVDCVYLEYGNLTIDTNKHGAIGVINDSVADAWIESIQQSSTTKTKHTLIKKLNK